MSADLSQFSYSHCNSIFGGVLNFTNFHCFNRLHSVILINNPSKIQDTKILKECYKRKISREDLWENLFSN